MRVVGRWLFTDSPPGGVRALNLDLVRTFTVEDEWAGGSRHFYAVFALQAGRVPFRVQRCDTHEEAAALIERIIGAGEAARLGDAVPELEV